MFGPGDASESVELEIVPQGTLAERIRAAGAGIPAFYVFGFVLGGEAVGIWLGLVFGLTLAALAMLWRFWGQSLPGMRGQNAGHLAPATDPH